MEKLLRTLIVDDSQIFCELLQSELQAFDVDIVDRCYSGERALELVTQVKAHYDAIFVDLHMEGMDGIELIRRLDKMEFRGGIIIVSSLDQSIVDHTMEVVKKLNVQLLGSILKPFDHSLVAFMVRRIRSMSPKPADKAPLSEAVVREAIAANRIEAYFQPVLNGRDNSLHSIESLCRLRTLENKILAPSKFLPTIAQFQLFDAFMPVFLKPALAGYVKICSRLHTNVPLRINLHQMQLTNNSLPEHILEAVFDEGVNPESVILEISERFSQNEIQLRNLARLRIAGFHLSLDDYGTGYTNIRQLSALPLNDIKIDKELIASMHRDRALKTVVESIKQVADELKLKVIAKGVHDPHDLILLEEIGIEIYQGHFFCRPKPAEECIRWLKKWRAEINADSAWESSK